MGKRIGPYETQEVFTNLGAVSDFRMQIKYTGANDFTGGMTWIQVPVSAYEPSEGYVGANYRTKCAAGCVYAVSLTYQLVRKSMVL